MLFIYVIRTLVLKKYLVILMNNLLFLLLIIFMSVCSMPGTMISNLHVCLSVNSLNYVEEEAIIVLLKRKGN